MNRRRVTRIAACGAALTLLLTAWYFLAPAELGGRTSYVTTYGDSMQPLLHAGDLAIVRRQDAYGVGDVVAYRSPDLDAIVLHRIVGVEGERYLFKGDHNTWLDSARPTRGQLVGKMIWHVPGAGTPLADARTPLGASAIVGFGSFVVLGGRRRMRGRDGRAERRRAPAGGNGSNGRARPTSGRRPGGGAAGPVLLGAALLALVAGGVLFALPDRATTDREVTFQQRGTFAYSASAPNGATVYGSRTVHTGDPVYLRLADRVRVTFRYALQTAAPVQTSGTADLVATIADVNGWSRTLTLSRPSAFDGSTDTVTGILDLRALSTLTARLEAATGIARDDYTVTVMPRIALEGTLAGRSVDETFAPQLSFLLDPMELQLVRTGAPAPGQTQTDPLAPVRGGSLTISTEGPRTLPLLGAHLRLEPLRAAAVALELCALVGLLLIAIGRFRAARRGEAALIHARYGRWLVPVRDSDLPVLSKVIDVGSFDALVTIARHYGHLILHEQAAGADTYFVDEGGVTYRYRIGAVEPA